MYAEARIPKDASLPNQKRGGGTSTFQLLDNRPEAIAQRKLKSSPNPASSGVVQRKIDGVTEALPPQLKELATTYNNLDGETPISARIGSLSQVEHAVYAWLTEKKKPDMNAVEGSAEVRKLMDATKAERHAIVERSVTAATGKLADIPIAGVGSLQHSEQLEVQALWQGLIAGTGKIRISDTDSDTNQKHAGFPMKVLVEFSRLLEGKFGRSMVKDINESTHQVVIEPFHVAQSGKSFAAGPVGGQQHAEKLEKLDAAPEQSQLAHYLRIDITHMNEEARLRLFNGLKPTQGGQLGVQIVDDNVSTYYKFGPGSAVRVTMPSDLPDASQHKESRLADAQGNELATPVFLTLGHELGHGIHMQRGTLTKETELPKFFKGQVDRRAYFSDQEEYVNIEGNENALRDEHGLGKRKGHHSIPYLQKQAMEDDINRWWGWFEKLGAVKKLPVYKKIEALLGDMGTRVFTEWADPDKLIAVRRDFAQLPAKIAKLQQDDFAAHIREESKHLSLGLYKIKFSFNIGFDIARIDLALDTEYRFEKVQADIAAENQAMPRYLAGLPAQRRDYARSHFDKVVGAIDETISRQPTELDQQQFKVMTGLLNEFENPRWLFQG